MAATYPVIIPNSKRVSVRKFDAVISFIISFMTPKILTASGATWAVTNTTAIAVVGTAIRVTRTVSVACGTNGRNAKFADQLEAIVDRLFKLGIDYSVLPVVAITDSTAAGGVTITTVTVTASIDIETV